MADLFGESRSRISDLLRGSAELLGIGGLVNMLTREDMCVKRAVQEEQDRAA